jgi:hypothetical protein
MNKKTNKIESSGYIIFMYNPDKSIYIHDCLCKTKKDLKNTHYLLFDDRWDWDKRNKYHFWYLDLSDMIYYPLEKWKTPKNKKDKFESNDLKEISTIYFKQVIKKTNND